MKTTKITIVMAAAMLLCGMPSLQAQEKAPKHELSVAFQGLGIGSMPFSGSLTWNDQPGLSLGFNIDYTYWFSKHFGFSVGVRLNSLRHNQKISNLDFAYNTMSGATAVSLRGTATTIQEEQQYNFFEVPLQLAMRFGGLFVNVGVSLSKAVSASADYSFTDPALIITALPGLGTSMATPVGLAGDTKGSVKNVDMTKPFYCLLDAEVGYNIPLGEVTSLAVGLFGRYAPVAYTTDNKGDLYALDPTAASATYSVSQPSTSAQVEKIGYYEVGVSLGVNFGISRKRKGAFSEEQQPVLTPVDNRYDQAASEIAALKAACEKNEAEIAALRASQKKAQDDMAAIRASQQKAQDDLAAMRAAAAQQAAQQAAAQQPSRPATQQPSNTVAQKPSNTATVYFDFKSTSVKPTAEEEKALQAICEAMKADAEMQVVITGHTDNSGSDKANWNYGIKRAQAVKRYMVKQGAPAKNVQCASKGEKEPIADNDSEEGRAKNRRATVEMK